MRYFRFTFNPLSLIVQGGTVTIRMQFALRAQMIYSVFVDGGWVKVPDADMGEWGGVTDFLYDRDAPGGPYAMVQEGVPVGIDVGLITLWSSQLVPSSTDPQVLPTPWPEIVIV